MTLLELFGLLRKKLVLVIVLPLACAAVVAVYAYGFMPDQYTADVSMYVLSRSGDTSSSSTSSSGVTNSDLSASQMLANDFATLAKSDRVMNNTAESLGMSSLNGYDVKVTSSTTTRVISLSVTGTNPTAVMTVANQMASEISSTAMDIMDLQSVNIIDSAKEPSVPSGPNRLLYIGVAFLVGLFLAVLIVVLADMMDTTVKSAKDAEETTGLPTLGNMPKVRGK